MPESTHNVSYRLFLEVLKDARKQKSVTQIELAARLGNTQTFVSKCERGERRLDLVEFVEFAEALGIPPLNLLGDYLARHALSVGAKKTAKRRKV